MTDAERQARCRAVAPRARGAGRGSECPGLRFAGSSSPHFALATCRRCFRRDLLTARRYAAPIGASEWKSSPVVMIAQAMRANLLASATVTNGVALYSRLSPLTEPVPVSALPGHDR